MTPKAQETGAVPDRHVSRVNREERDSSESALRAAGRTGPSLTCKVPPNAPTWRRVLALQQSVGNRNVARMLKRVETSENAESLRGGEADRAFDATPQRAVVARPAIPAPPGLVHRQHVQKGEARRPPMIFPAETLILGRPDMRLFGVTTPFSRRWPILKPTIYPLAGGTFILDGVPISYSLHGQASASSAAALMFGPGYLRDVRLFVTGPEADRLRRPNVIVVPSVPPLILPDPRERKPRGAFSADANLQFSAFAAGRASASARLEGGLGVFGNVFNAGAFAGLSGAGEASAAFKVNTYVQFTWTDGTVAISAVLDIDTALTLAIMLSAFAGVWVELRFPDIPVVTSLMEEVEDWPVLGWIVPDLSKWRWRKEYRKDWPLLEQQYKWSVTQRFAISSGSQAASFPEPAGFDMEKVIRDLEARQRAGDLKDDPEGPGTEKRNSDPAAVSAARAAALAQISSARRAAEREKKANARLLRTARKAAAAASRGPSTASAPPVAVGSGPADPVAQLEEREKKLDQAVKSTDQLRQRTDQLGEPAAAADGVSRNQARAGYESVEKNADVLGDKINRNEDAFAVPAAAEPGDADYARMQAARKSAYDAFDACYDPARTEKLWADDQLRAAGSDADVQDYRKAAYEYQIKALELWQRVLKLEDDLEKAREWYERTDYALGATVFAELESKAVWIKDDAAGLQRERPRGDWDEDYVELSGGHLVLMPEYRGKATRRYFYPHDYSPATQNSMWLKIGGVVTGDDGKLYWEYRGQKSPRGDFLWLVHDQNEQPTLDHTRPTVVGHWNTTGRTTDYAPRKRFYDFEGADVVVVPKTLNSEAGGRESASYTPRVTRSFRGSKT